MNRLFYKLEAASAMQYVCVYKEAYMRHPRIGISAQARTDVNNNVPYLNRLMNRTYKART